MRAAAKLPVPKRKITAEVSKVGQGVGIWVARTLVDCRERRCGGIMLGRSWSERAAARRKRENVIPAIPRGGAGDGEQSQLAAPPVLASFRSHGRETGPPERHRPWPLTRLVTEKSTIYLELTT